MSNIKKSSQNEDQKKLYKINIIKNLENEITNNIKGNNNEYHFILKSKSINDINKIKNVLENSFKEKKSSKNSSNEPRVNSLFFQSKKSISRDNNKSNIFYEEPISPIKKYWENNKDNSFALNLIKLTNQLYESEEHFNKSIISPKNESNINISKNANTEKNNSNDKNMSINKKYNSTKSLDFFNKDKPKKRLKIISKFKPINNKNLKEKEIKYNNNKIINNNKNVEIKNVNIFKKNIEVDNRSKD